MNLFQIDELTSEVKVNVPWIKLIPEFKALFNTGTKLAFDRNVMGRKKLSYIYFMLDFSSPISSWEDSEKRKEALTYTDLQPSDVDTPAMKEAMMKYEELQFALSRSLKTYRAALRGLEALDRYLETVDFSAVDKQGKLLYTPNQFTTNMASINKAYDELGKLKKRIEEELGNTSSIRGSATMGDREMKTFGKAKGTEKVDWDEQVPDSSVSIKWTEIGELLDGEQ